MTLTIEVPDETRYITSAIIVGYGEESRPIFFNFDTNTFSGAKINESGKITYMREEYFNADKFMAEHPDLQEEQS